MISYQEALETVLTNAKDFGDEDLFLEDSLNRVLSEEIFCPRDLPPFNRAAMDGIAIQIEDFKAGIRTYQVVETIFAGQEHTKELQSAECYKIMTGAAVPPSAQSVVQTELISFLEDKATLKTEICLPGQNIAPKGQDLKKGQSVIRDKRAIKPSTIGLLASLGYQKIKVKRLPNVAICTSGNEVRPLGTAISDTQIYNSNSYLLTSLLRQNGIEPVAKIHMEDNAEQMESVLSKLMDKDIIILNGGVSAGEADFIPRVLEKLSVKCLFHKVAIKPGKPIWCGKTPSGGMVFALPGNPLSCMVTFCIFVLPFIKNCWGLANGSNQNRLPFAGLRKKKNSLDEFFPAEADYYDHEIKSCPSNGSGDIRLGLYANSIAHHPKNIEVLNNGDLVDFRLI